MAGALRFCVLAVCMTLFSAAIVSSTPCDRKCPPGQPLICFVAPCFGSSCDIPGAECCNDYCGVCNARWFINNWKNEVTSQCNAS